MKKPYVNTRDVSYKMLISHPYFRTLSEKELHGVLDYMEFKGYQQIPGEVHTDKLEYIKKLLKTKKMPSKKTTAPRSTKVEPISEFDDYIVRSNGTKVTFGCGEVEVAKTDLRRLALIVGNQNRSKSLREVALFSRAEVGSLSQKDRKSLLKIWNNPVLSKDFETLSRVAEATNERYEIDDLLGLKPETFLGLAAAPSED